MNLERPTPPETWLCSRCDGAYDGDDNFCRHCGSPLFDDEQLPVVRETRLPAVSRPSVPASFVRGAAVVAFGKLAEMAVRRLARIAIGRGSGRASSVEKMPAGGAKGEIVPREDSLPEDALLVSETVMVRRVRIRR